MRVTLLGSAAAGGVPLYGCTCPACIRALSEPKARREPCSALIEASSTRILIDAGLTDLHQRFAPGSLDAILLTHYHADHVQGLFHLRWGVGEKIPVFGPPDPEGCADLYRNCGLLSFREVSRFAPFSLGELRITPLPLRHSRPTLGYAIAGPDDARFAYLTDTQGLPAQTLAYLKTWGKYRMALDCTYPPGAAPANHNDWTQALADVAASGAQSAWLTHLGHRLDAWLLAENPPLPGNVRVAADGETIDLAGSSR